MCDMKALKIEYGPEQAKLIALRLTQIAAADNLEDLRSLPQVRAHELKWNRADQISLDLRHPYRMLITPDHDDIPRNENEGLDWQKITKIKVLGVEDTHD